MTGDEYVKSYVARLYFTILSIALITSIVCLCIAVPFVISADKYGSDITIYSEEELQEADRLFVYCSNIEDEFIRDLSYTNVLVLYVIGAVCGALVVLLLILPLVNRWLVRKRQRDRHKMACKLNELLSKLDSNC